MDTSKKSSLERVVPGCACLVKVLGGSEAVPPEAVEEDEEGTVEFLALGRVAASAAAVCCCLLPLLFALALPCSA